MSKLKQGLWSLQKNNRDGSYSTQANRRTILFHIADELVCSGYTGMSIHSLKPKHVEALVDKWKLEEQSTGTIKNRMAALRWWAGKVNKSAVIKRKNEDYGIGQRTYVTNVSKAVQLDTDKLVQIQDQNIAFSLRLQEQFGLRREESIKFTVAYADNGDHLKLKPSWTKGGRGRNVPIIHEAQRELLNEIKHARGNASLIDAQLSYKQQLKKYENSTSRVGLHKLHGLRHLYAQRRFKELTGWDAPAAGGPRTKDLSVEQKAIDDRVRLEIAEELGHSRKSITATYLGA